MLGPAPAHSPGGLLVQLRIGHPAHSPGDLRELSFRDAPRGWWVSSPDVLTETATERRLLSPVAGIAPAHLPSPVLPLAPGAPPSGVPPIRPASAKLTVGLAVNYRVLYMLCWLNCLLRLV